MHLSVRHEKLVRMHETDILHLQRETHAQCVRVGRYKLPIQGGRGEGRVEILLGASTETKISSGRMGHLACMQTFDVFKQKAL